MLTNNIRDFGNNKGELHQSLSSSRANFKLIRNISDLKLELGEIPALTDSQRSSNSLSEIKINQVFQKKQIDVLIEHLNGAISEYYKYRDFEFTVHANLRLIQLADLEVLTLTAQPGSEDDNIQEFFGTVTANLKIEIYETSSRRIMNGCRINLVEVFNKPFLFDFEVILNDKDYIEHLEISNLSEIHESLEECDLPSKIFSQEFPTSFKNSLPLFLQPLKLQIQLHFLIKLLARRYSRTQPFDFLFKVKIFRTLFY